MNNRVFLLTYNDAAGSREEVRDLIDSLDFVTNWITWSQNALFLVAPAEVTARKISDGLEQLRAKEGARFFVSHVDEDSDGWLPRAVWTFLKEPKAIWEEQRPGKSTASS
jgi:hypothetical protein